MVRTVAVAAVVFAALRSTPVEACSCMPSSPEHAYGASAVVFVGTLRGIDRHPKAPVFDDYAAFDLEVTEVFKGAPGERLEIYSPVPVCCNCSVFFDIGESYLVFAYRQQNGVLYTSDCFETVSTDVSYVPDELAWLRKLAIQYPGFLVASAARASVADGVVRALARPVHGQPPLPPPWYGTAPPRKPPHPPLPPISSSAFDFLDD